MKIIESNPQVKFNNIDVGKVFKHNTSYYLKIPKMIYRDTEVNAIFLNEGYPCYFDVTEMIIPVDCELVIK